MATQSNIDIKIIAEFLGKNAFKQADTAANKLNKTVKSLGQSFGLAFGGAALGYAVKSTIKDFADAQRETVNLTNTVKNLGLAFDAPQLTAYVDKIGQLYGVTGDQAVPALQSLLSVTGSVSKSTEIFNTALDLAASRSADVSSVAQDLAKAYVGNTKSLNQYDLGLTKAELSAKSFEEIMAIIGKQTLGAADEAAQSLSGQLAILSETANQAKERIGGALFEALGGMAGPNGAGGAAKNIENLSIKLSEAISGFGYLVQEVKIAQPILVAAGVAIGLAWAPWFTAIAAAGLAIGAIGNAMKKSKPPVAVNTGPLMFPTAGDGGYKQREAARKKAEADAAKRAKQLLAMQNAANKAQKDALKLAKAKSIFDLEKIQIEAALKGKLSEEDRIRLKLMKAIENENLSDVEKYQKALEVAQTKTKELTDLLATIKTLEIKDPFGTWSVDPLTAAINALTTSIGGVGTQIQASGREWASFANTVANTVIRPNLSEWSSSFSNAGTAAANASKAAIDAANKAATDALAAATKAQQEALKKLNEENAASNAAAEKAAKDALNALEKTYSEKIAALKAAAAEAAAKAAAIGTVNTTTLEGVIAASGTGSTSNNNTTVEITVNAPPFTDPNAIAEVIDQIIIDAVNRGTLRGGATIA